jgi:MoaA/NifB/PqqE/SkfB family radical SAM enzyme
MVWHINEYCNFGCSYCFFDKFKQENPAVGRLSPKEIQQAFENTGRKWHLFITGGEPLLYPKFNELVNLLKPDHPIQISTNLYHKNVKAFAEEVSPENIITINVSLHIMHHSDSSLKQLLKNYHLLREKGFEILISYVTYPKLFHRIEQDFEFLKKEGVEYIIPLTYCGEYEGKRYPGNYTWDQARIIERIYQEPLELLVMMEQMKWQGQKCSAGKDYFHMNLNGDVSRCCTIQDKGHGNIYDGTFHANDISKPCPVGTCMDHCQGIMSVEPRPEPVRIPPMGPLEKGVGYIKGLTSSLLNQDPKELRALSKEEQTKFIRK